MLNLADLWCITGLLLRFLCWHSRIPVLAVCASFRASLSVGSSGGLIALAQKSHYLFFLLSNCTYNSNIIKNEYCLACFMRIPNSCVICKFQTVYPGGPSSQPHTFWSTAIRRDIRGDLYFCSCKLRWRSIECVLLPCFNALPDIFAGMNSPVLGYRW